MKKLFVLMVLVVAMVAAPLFAEITEDGWAGDFTYKIGGNFKEAAVDAVSTDLDLSMSAMVGEITTFSVGLGSGGSGTNVTVNTIKMTQDFSASVDGLDTLKYTVGSQNLGITEYETIGMMNHTDSVTAESFIVCVGAAGVTAKVFVYPESLLNDADKTFAVEVAYSSDMVSGNVAFVQNGANPFFEAGLKAVVADLTAAAMVEMDLTEDATTTAAYVGLQYAMAPVTAKAGFYTGVMAEGADMMDTASAKVGVDFAATDTVTVKAGATIPFAEGADIAFDAGVCAKFDTVEYKVAVDYMGSGYVAAYKATDNTWTEDIAVSFQMDVDF